MYSVYGNRYILYIDIRFVVSIRIMVFVYEYMLLNNPTCLVQKIIINIPIDD